MEGHCGWVRTRRGDQLPILQVCERALDSASRQPGGRGDGLMGRANRPVRPLRCLTIEVKVDYERTRPAVVAHQVRQEAIEYVCVKADFYHQ